MDGRQSQISRKTVGLTLPQGAINAAMMLVKDARDSPARTGIGEIFIPLTIRKRNGRPKIVPPADLTLRDGRAQDPHVLRAIARAWSWRRQLETGAASTSQDIAAAEKVSDRFVSRMMRLA